MDRTYCEHRNLAGECIQCLHVALTTARARLDCGQAGEACAYEGAQKVRPGERGERCAQHVEDDYAAELARTRAALSAAEAHAAAEAAKAERLAVALRRQVEMWGSMPSGADELADENDPSPNDAVAHSAGIAIRYARAALALTPTAALAEHDAALLARVAPMVESAREVLLHAEHAQGCWGGGPGEPSCTCGIEALRAALAAHDKEQTP